MEWSLEPEDSNESHRLRGTGVPDLGTETRWSNLMSILDRYPGLTADTLDKMIKAELRDLASLTNGAVSVDHIHTPNGSIDERTYHLKVSGDHKEIPINQIVDWIDGYKAALIWYSESRCGREFMAGALCVAPEGHAGGCIASPDLDEEDV